MPGQAPCWKGRPGPCRGDASDDLVPSFRACGARPSTERPSGDKGACLASPGMAWKAVFSEGRTPCVRVVRPSGCPGISFPPRAYANGRWPTRHMPRSGPCFPCGRAEPSPPRGASLARMALREKPETTRKAVFSEGRTLCVRMARPYPNRGTT